MTKEKNEYQSMHLEIIKFNVSDVIATSEAYIEDDNDAWV